MTDVLDLLAEVEGALNDVPVARRLPAVGARTPSVSLQPAAPPLHVHAPQAGDRARRGKSQVDDLLSMLDEEPGPTPGLPRGASSVGARAGSGSTPGPPVYPKCTGGSSGGNKCSSVYLGSAVAELGLARSTTRRACSELLCVSCDFAVLRFVNKRWSSRVDYLYFRNRTPDRARLSVELEASEGAAAYCCQCSWASILPSDTPQGGAVGGGGLLCIRRAGGAVPVTRAGAADATPVPMGTPSTGMATEGSWGDPLGASELDGGLTDVAAAAARDALPERLGGQGWACWTCAGHA